MVIQNMTKAEAEIRARVRALTEGVRVHLESESADIMVYTCASMTRLGLVYTVTLTDPDSEAGKGLEIPDVCTCLAGSYGRPCKHVQAAWLMMEATLDLRDVQAEAEDGPVCQCCGWLIDIHGDCACSCKPSDQFPPCTHKEGCVWDIKQANTALPMSAKLEQELADLF